MLQTHLKPLERDGIVDLWDDTKITAGAIRKEELQKAIASARVAITLVSANFLASDFISKYELPALLSHANSKGTVIIPVIVSDCSFNESELNIFQALNRPDKPLNTMRPAKRDQILAKLTRDIKSWF